MDFSKVENFLRVHWPAALIVAIISIPVIWTIASIHYAQEITALNVRLVTLEIQVEDLQQYKKRAETLETERLKIKFVGGVVGFSSESLADSLFSPSDIE